MVGSLQGYLLERVFQDHLQPTSNLISVSRCYKNAGLFIASVAILGVKKKYQRSKPKVMYRSACCRLLAPNVKTCPS